MAGNPISQDDDAALAMAEDIADGLHQLEGALGITGEAKMRAVIAACRGGDNNLRLAKDARQTASDELVATDEAAAAFLSATKNVLAGFLGNRWSPKWEPTGFPDESTAVPLNQEKRMNLCASLKTYFTANAAKEVAALNVTAAKAEEHYTALSDGRDELAEKVTDMNTKDKARAAAYRALRKRMRSSISELAEVLADDDERWHRFGLNAPADPNSPEPVASLTLTAGLPGKIVATWPRAARATRYRPYVQIVGVDEEFKARDAVHDLTVTLDSFTTGQTVKVYIVAANDDGEAPEGPTQQIVVP
ncbi:MAG: hypothetical protein HZC54_00190 [Verrucomicrobia bacterium]|nr:hypothetical protein [Verrucomicrobiota bacterium]